MSFRVQIIKKNGADRVTEGAAVHDQLSLLGDRPTKSEYYMSVAQLVAQRSTCIRRHIGAVIVVHDQIVSTGYNGAPRGMQHCADLGCLRDELQVPRGERYELCRSVHAEANAIIQAARAGVAIKEGTMYVTSMPCFMCAKQLVNAGITNVVILDAPEEAYYSQSKLVLEEAGVDLTALMIQED